MTLARNQPPTLEEVEAFLLKTKFVAPGRFEGDGIDAPLAYKGKWQRRIMRHLCENRYSILQAPRQNVGKTWCVSVYIAVCLCKGLSVVIGMPTLNQGERILVDRVDGLMREAENVWKSLRRRTDNVRYKRWTNGAVLGIISMAEGSKAGAQGFTADLLVCDEAHEALPEMFAVVEPTVNVARETGSDRIILVGVGGNSEEHLIERRKRDAEDQPSDLYASLILLPDDLIAERPAMEQMYADIRRGTPESTYRQHYLMQPQVEGAGYIFPRLMEEVELGSDSWMEFGIDVGRVSNKTVVHALHCGTDSANLIETLRIVGEDFAVQAVKVSEFINKYLFIPENVRYEQNTIGYGLSDPLKRIYPFYNITPVLTEDSPPDLLKTNWILWLQHLAVTGRLGVKDQRTRLQLKRLMYKKEIQPNNKLRHIWPESRVDGVDELSALWVWGSGRAERQAAAV